MGSILFSFSPLNSHSNTFFVLAQLFVDDNCFIVVIFYWHKSGISRKKKKSLRSPFFLAIYIHILSLQDQHSALTQI